MTQRECILDFLKRQIFDVVSRSGRNGIAEYALRRWEGAGLEAMKNPLLPIRQSSRIMAVLMINKIVVYE